MSTSVTFSTLGASDEHEEETQVVHEEETQVGETLDGAGSNRVY